jgi:hypothetical protein
MSGWIKLHREMLNWEWYDHIPTKTLFIHLLLSCNHKDNKYRGTEVKRGQTLTGRKQLSIETGLSERQIRTALDNLKASNEIAVKTTSKGSVVTVVKYDLYQNNTDNSTSKTPTKSPDSDHLSTTNNNDNNDKELNNKAKPKSVEQVFQYMTEINYPDARFNSEQFYNHYEANGWMRGRTGKQQIKDWRAVVRTWMGRVKKDDKLVKDEYGSVVGQKTDYSALAKYYGITEEEARKHYKPIN